MTDLLPRKTLRPHDGVSFASSDTTTPLFAPKVVCKGFRILCNSTHCWPGVFLGHTLGAAGTMGKNCTINRMICSILFQARLGRPLGCANGSPSGWDNGASSSWLPTDPTYNAWSDTACPGGGSGMVPSRPIIPRQPVYARLSC